MLQTAQEVCLLPEIGDGLCAIPGGELRVTHFFDRDAPGWKTRIGRQIDRAEAAAPSNLMTL
jgi:hypothetical protein